MFESVARVPGDAILGLIQQFNNDPNPAKVDLGVGVYKDVQGNTPILRAVKAAEQTLVDGEKTKSYIGSHGDPRYGEHVLSMVFGADSKILVDRRASATQAPGGTGALRLAADFVAAQLPGKSLWLPEPTWPNHIAIAHAAGLDIQRYPYVDADNRLDFDAMLACLKSVPEGDVVLLHACCHNPSGFDPSREQWQLILQAIKERKLLPLVDFAYQGFGDGLDDDAYAVRLLAENLDEMLITQSCSKNFGLYRERTGCFIAVAKNAESMADVRSQLAVTARANYSNPPAHGAAVVTAILDSDELRVMWERELDEMRDRINGMRRKLVDGMEPHGLRERFAFVAAQRGMFSYTGLSSEQVTVLRDKHSIYMVGSGRANVAGLSDANIGYVCQAIADVTGNG
ncbi:MAG TPA: amino acid aminotransferase [Oleiagrimonas sp.]|nr:amino acid aminotransferase [Oleiagrimonas sp.]